MGGYGSGRKTCKKTTVEECLTLSMRGLANEGTFHQGATGTVVWTWPDGHEARIGFRYHAGNARHSLWLTYTITDHDGTRTDHEYPVDLSADSCRFGGCQWYFVCPVSQCGRRVRQLHKPPRQHIFACRHCYSLTYQSVQEHDARVNRFFDDADALEKAVRGSDSQLILALKARET